MIKKILILLLIVIALILSLVWLLNTEIVQALGIKMRTSFYGEPISEDGMINNDFFEIKSDGTNPIETRRGLSNAIKYANQNNI